MVGMGCRAQTIYSLYDDAKEVVGAYYKDIYNDLNNFVGTWEYTNGTTSLTIILQKKEIQYFDAGHIHYYQDLLIGEYKYIEDGIEKINTLPELQIEYADNWDHNLAGTMIIGPNAQYCQNCGPNDRKVVLGFLEPGKDIFGFEPEMIFQRADDGNIQRLKLVFRNMGVQLKRINENTLPPYTSYTIPFGEYLLVKQ